MDAISEKAKRLQTKLDTLAKSSSTRKKTIRDLEKGVKSLEKGAKRFDLDATRFQAKHFRKMLGWGIVAFIMLLVLSVASKRSRL